MSDMHGLYGFTPIRCGDCGYIRHETATTCPKCASYLRNTAAPSDGTLTAIRAIAAHVTDSRLAMAAIRVLLEEK